MFSADSTGSIIVWQTAIDPVVNVKRKKQSPTGTTTFLFLFMNIILKFPCLFAVLFLDLLVCLLFLVVFALDSIKKWRLIKHIKEQELQVCTFSGDGDDGDGDDGGGGDGGDGGDGGGDDGGGDGDDGDDGDNDDDDDDGDYVLE